MINTAEYYLNQGIAKHENDDYAGAIEDFNKAIELDPNLALAYYHRSKIMSRKDKDVIEDLRKTIELDPSFVEVYALLADLLLLEGCEDESEQLYKDALEIAPDFINGYFGMARVCLLNGDKEGAEGYATKAVEFNPSSERTHLLRAWLRHVNSNLEGALEDANKTIEIAPDNISAIDLRAKIRYELRDFTGAIQDFTKAIEIDFLHSFAYLHRGLCKCQLGDLNGGILELNQAIDIYQEDWFYYSRGVILFILGKYQLAKMDFDKAIKLHNKFEEVYPYRGAARYMLGDKAGARREWKRCGMNTKSGVAFMNNVLTNFDFDNLY